ncbi:uncharacterized protein LOC118372392 isoform X3 [Oncorhynchus keta]|uniref:uncharacterized protein LOC118372392 isoform X3 n=1 Tax=Oncorhynchus keta TaxID=8018 RepID=UPI00227CF6A4|nr:uncharacterized protein LOC118372392 isoform X3 [Oncorhynchus keta]
MSKLKLIRLCFWFYLVRTVVSKDHKMGGELVLTPDKSTVSDPITSILWKHGKDKVAEWDKDFGGLDIYGAFKERTTLDQTTGELRISGLKKTDSGVYSVEFNSKQLDQTYNIYVIKAVPKPTITSSCNPDKTSCTLTCEGDTTDAEPVIYSWKVGERASNVSDKQLSVSKSTNGIKYTCKLSNAVSSNVSEPVGEVFGSGFLVWKKTTEYPQDTWIDFLRKYFGGIYGRICGDAGNNQNTVALDTVYSVVGEKSSRDYSMNQNNNNQPTNTVFFSAKGTDGVQPEQGKSNADKAEKGQGNEDHKVGGELVLTPDKSTVSDPITSILWKHGKDKVAEWDKDFGGLDIYGAFKERTTLDQTTGELRISGLMKTDSGVYSVEFNSKLLDQTYTLSVIKAVPKPTITSSCNPDKTSCTLTCEGDTTDAEPVTYSWKVGEGAWEDLDKQINVNKSDTGKSTNSYKYICKMKNPVSEEVSDPIGQGFGQKAVPKPTITYTCSTDKICTLTCEGDTTDAEPVIYSWKVGEGAWEVIGKRLIVSKSDTGKSTNSYKYICKLKNSAGEEEVSDPVGSVFGPEPSEVGGGGIVGVVVIIAIVALVAIVITVWLVWKKKKEYPQDTWIDFLRKYCGGMCGVPLTPNTKTGEDGADKAGKGPGNEEANLMMESKDHQ